MPGPYEARRAAEAAASARGEQLATSGSQCVPCGVPTMMSVAIYPMEIIQSPKQVTIISEAFSEVRRVYLDRPQAKIEDVAPGYYGRSVGHWDGNLLVVDTVGIKSSASGYRGMPHSDQMRITERFKLVQPDYLQDQISIEDPVVLEKPVTYTLAYKRVPDYEMVEFVCDNNREYVDENGIVRMKVRTTNPRSYHSDAEAISSPGHDGEPVCGCPHYIRASSHGRAGRVRGSCTDCARILRPWRRKVVARRGPMAVPARVRLCASKACDVCARPAKVGPDDDHMKTLR